MERADPIDLASSADSALGPLILRPSLCEVEIGGVVEKLEPRVMQVLVALERAAGRLVSRDDLIRLCWGGAIVTDDAINRVLVRLRRLTAKTAGAVRIETVRSIGYRLIAAPAAEAAASAQAGNFLWKRWPLLAAAAAVALFAITAGFLIPGPTRGERVVVLPFRTEGQGLQPYSDTLAERIRGALSIGDLHTIARARPEDYRGADMARRAAQDSVGFILDGVITRQGGNLVVFMQVIDVRANLALWTKEYRRASTEDLWLEEQIAAHAAEVLRCALITRRGRGEALAPEVLAAFMRACDRVEQFEAGGSDMMAVARELTQSAPQFSRAWSMLAMSAAMASHSAPPERAEQLRTEARTAADRARRIDRSNGESTLALALLLAPGGDFTERDALISRALAIDPTLSDAHVTRAFLLMEVGRTGEALTHLRDAAALDPLAPTNWAALLPVLSTNGQHTEAARLRERLLHVWPHSPAAQFNAFKNRMFNGAPGEALAMLNDGSVELRPAAQSAVRAYLQAAVSQDRRRLHTSVAALADLARHGAYDLPSTISSAALAGELDLAFELSELYLAGTLQGVSPSTPRRGATSHFMFLPPTENLRRDPRFMQLANRAGLIRYWRESGYWPDFCRRPDLPYDCQAEANRVSPAASL